MSAGKLVPNELIYEILKNELLKDKYANGVILDGFPREYDNIILLDELCSELDFYVLHCVNLTVDKNSLFERLNKRKLEFPERKDNDIDIYKTRLEVYENLTIPVVKYYEKLGKIIFVESAGDIDEINYKIYEKIKIEDKTI
jgi:adenylate kinase